MTLLTCSFEGITPSGTTVTTGNSGGFSGNAFDVVTIGTGATLASDSTHAANGALGCQMATGVTAAAVNVQWTTSLGTVSQAWFRIYLYLTANPAAALRLIFANNSGTRCANLQVTTGGKLQWLNTSGSSITGATTANSVPLNAWCRIEGFVLGSATAGQVETRLFTTVNGTNPLEIVTSAPAQNTAGSMNGVIFGPNNTNSNVGPFWVDDLGLSTTGYIGPAQVAGGAVQPGGPTWRRLFRKRQQQVYSVPGGNAQTGTSALAGTGVLTAAGSKAAAGSSSVAGTSVPAPAGTKAATGTGNLAGTGTPAATGTKAATGTGTLAGTGVAAGTGAKAATGTSRVAGTGTESPSGAKAGTGTSDVAGTGTLSPSGAKNAAGTGRLAGTGTESGTGAKGAAGTSQLAGTGTVAPAGVKGAQGSSSVAGTGILSAIGQAVIRIAQFVLPQPGGAVWRRLFRHRQRAAGPLAPPKPRILIISIGQPFFRWQAGAPGSRWAIGEPFLRDHTGGPRLG